MQVPLLFFLIYFPGVYFYLAGVMLMVNPWPTALSDIPTGF